MQNVIMFQNKIDLTHFWTKKPEYFKAINFQDRGWAVVGANSLTKGDFIVVSCKRPQERNSGLVVAYFFLQKISLKLDSLFQATS